MQASNVVDSLLKPILDKVNDLIGPLPLIGNGAPKARGEPLGVVEQSLPDGKTLRAEGTDEAGVNGTSEDLTLQPPVASTTANSPANCPCQGSSSVVSNSTPLNALAPGGSAGDADGGEGVSDSGEAT